MFFFYPWLCQKEKYKVKKKLPRHIGILPRQNQLASAIACRGTFFLIQRAVSERKNSKVDLDNFNRTKIMYSNCYIWP